MAKKKVASVIRSIAMKKSWAERRKSPMREAARKRAAAPKDKGQPKFWILWAPSSYKPPKIRFGTLEKVREVARIMVEKYRCEFFVMESVELHKLSSQMEVVKYGATEKKKAETKEETAPFTFQVRPSPPPLFNQGRSWDQEQDNYLMMLWHNGFRDLNVLGDKMGRSGLAIEFRLDALKLRRYNG